MKRIVLFIGNSFTSVIFATYTILFGAQVGWNDIKLNSEQLWNSTVKEYLQKELWNGNEAYIAGNSLMVPMHIAFQEHKKEWITDFHFHFSNLSKNGLDSLSINEERLNTLQYYYLISRFLYLSLTNQVSFTYEEKLTNHLIKEMKKIWINSPAWMWDMENFTGVKDRVLWKLKSIAVKKSYYRAITDEELFIFSISADLKSILSLQGKRDPIIDDIVSVGYTTYVNESTFTSTGKWIFQPGVYKDHPDYKYAGTDFIFNEELSFHVNNIGKDTSHSHRFPLWIISLKNCFPNKSKQSLFLQKILTGLESQFYEEVLVLPKDSNYLIPLTKNYMDGTNGIYRYNYPSLNHGDGYYPFELSGTFTLGWWSFLGTNRIRQVYRDLSLEFPLHHRELDVILKEPTDKKRVNLKSIASGELAFKNGYRQLICYLASKNISNNGTQIE
ncbi:hypothetical protein [Metabacillus halosaccharovorans]|uniref:Uncharacterized protein n=1 Tax=Metabacillus halosaccharovorans TaxID=930124 RepID=A0ABT3DD17_9BACI|nr:hypothetical protein [Metabacillus halosaccharovorans]MCV9884761.1 hypothetical protein [Metabacillus halosaccharovorans]